MEVNYKGHHITVNVNPVPGTQEWEAKLLIDSSEESRELFQDVTLGKHFATQPEAAGERLAFAKKWIDDGKPSLVKDDRSKA